MKIATSIVGTTVLVLLVAAAARPVAQTLGLQAELLKDLASSRETMLKIADAMPEEKFSFKATPAERRTVNRYCTWLAGTWRFSR
jgi:hypothetical protein